MKNYSIFLLLLVLAINLHAQDYQISFAGTGASATVDSVKVENLTQGKSLTIGGSEVLHLVKTITGINPSLDYENTFRIYPNPMTDNSTVDFVATAPGTATIELFETNGKRVVKVQSILTIGAHSFNVRGLCRGIYTVRINSNAYTYTGKLINKGEDGSDVKICYNGERDISIFAKSLTIASVEKSMQYTTGDQLKITGKSGNFSTVCTVVPTQSKTISFTFVACTDADGNNYPVVQIGTQLWMAENLKTTKFNDGSNIPNITSGEDLTLPSYYWYNNEQTNKNIYGGLYNWYATITGKFCPVGWHIPSYTEWTTLNTYLGGESLAGYKLKESGINHWKSPNKDATNESGFTALPGGWRGYTGVYLSIGSESDWWSTTELDTTDAFICFLNYFNGESIMASSQKTNGMSVRCIKD